jgi:Tfp pilus assembly protein PilE
MRSSRGVTLIEALVTVGVAGIFCTALYGFYRLHSSVLQVEEVRLGLRESSRLAVDFMARELHMAGARPVRGSACAGFERLTEAEAQRVTMQYDFRGNSATAPPDGCPDDPSERISYVYNSTEQTLRRATTTGAPQPFISDVPPEGFLLRYFDRDGGELIPPLTAQARAAVHSIRIEVLTRKAYSSPLSAEPLESAFAATVFFVNPPE